MGYKVKRSLANRIATISRKRGIPYVTVETCVKDLLQSYKESAKNGENIVIDGLVSIHLYQDKETGEIFGRCRISPALQNMLKGVKELNRDVYGWGKLENKQEG